MLHTKIIDTSKNEKIEISKAENFLNQSKFGAVIYFVGTVRDLNENKTVTGITYDAKESMVIKSFEEIYEEADNKLNIKEKAVFIEHVKGYVGLKEKSIIIGVATPIIMLFSFKPTYPLTCSINTAFSLIFNLLSASS